LKTRDQLLAGQWYNLQEPTAAWLIVQGFAAGPAEIKPPVGPSEIKPAGPSEIKVPQPITITAKKKLTRARTVKGS
jgi:hypothetical protein